MNRKKMGVFRLVPAVWAALLLAGCAGVAPVETGDLKPVPAAEKSAEPGWWYARFRMKWPPDAEPAWYLDVLLAHRVVSPVLHRHQKDILLWRFHRRAARDVSGHQFSFIFYASREKARQIYHGLQSSALLQAMQAGGTIIEAVYDDLRTLARPQIQDTSDRNWSSPIQKTWPFFIMGVSQMWLNLIEEIAGPTPEDEAHPPPAQLEAFYRQVQTTLIATWQTEGRHAFLHHLNALFGYEPVIVYEKRFMRF
ncbi:MAG: hypothetical protein JSW39_24995 [Desulfobacterales bacterium]|nr:MAG: hypothetical protein JSW39_24995 [Desulfobacterales bacterium]